MTLSRVVRLHTKKWAAWHAMVIAAVQADDENIPARERIKWAQYVHKLMRWHRRFLMLSWGRSAYHKYHPAVGGAHNTSNRGE